MSGLLRPTILLIVILLATGARADQIPNLLGGDTPTLHGGGADPAKAVVDSVFIIGPWGSGAQANGQFENTSGLPDWNGWTHRDMTIPESQRWQIDPYQADNLAGHGPGNLAAWCGEAVFPACYELDPPGGYGNNYNEILSWTGTVADSGQPCTVTVDAWLNHHLEFGYDFLSLNYHSYSDGSMTVWSTDGQGSNVHLQESFVLQPADYLGDAALRNKVRLEFKVLSDGAFSDADCFFASAGACQIDDITVSLSNGGMTTHDDFQSGEWASWTPEAPVGVGDFSNIFWFLEDIDPCFTNYSPQVAFIDDGIVIPETGGQVCLNWCYGPGGYIVNTRGGLAGPSAYLQNKVLSPVLTWPASGAEGAILAFDVFEHEDLSPDAPGIFHTWFIRSTTSTDPGDLALAPWDNRHFILYGPGTYTRYQRDVSDLMEPGTTYAQVSFDVQELGYYWGWVGDDGYPAPYFDNVRLVAFSQEGPSITARHLDLAQDGFPAAGIIDLDNEANNSVRFDMAMNISPPLHERIDPGDSVVATIVPRRPGGQLQGMPRLWFKLQANPVFDAYRNSGLPNTGFVWGSQVMVGNWEVQDEFAFDLPDSGFLFPGDVLHYYLEARSESNGVLQTATLPSDTTGFSDFSGPLAYDTAFTVRALPSLVRDGFSGLLERSPNVLLWDDGGNLQSWVDALDGLGQDLGQDYDLFSTRTASSGAGNGLGSRATPEVLDSYRTLLYTSGTRFTYTLCNGDFSHDGSDDINLLHSWLSLGDKSMFLTGDNLITDLSQSGYQGEAFRNDWLKVGYIGDNLRPFISEQPAPRVVATSGPQAIFNTATSWIAYGGCPGINAFDAVTAAYPGQSLAEFTDPAGQVGMYPYTAVCLNDLPDAKTVIPDHNSAIITMPYDFQFIYTDPSGNNPGPPLTAREGVLLDVLYFFGEYIIWGDAEMPETRVLTARNYPNPFNPATTIEFNLPRQGKVSVKVFDTRGRLVKTLLDEQREAGPGQVIWDGADQRGSQVASGLYFYEVRAGGQTQVDKMTVIK